MDKNKIRTFFIWWMIAVVCWVFLKIGTDIHKWQKIDEANERASERASRRNEKKRMREISRN